MSPYTIVFVILSILSAIAVYAAGVPISKSSMAHYEPGSDDVRDIEPGTPSTVQVVSGF
jgi:hypothetical protein